MPLKVSHNKEINKVADVPKDFVAFREHLVSLYGDKLPEKYRIEYTDTKGDRILIDNEQDYLILTQWELKQPQRSVKVYIYPVDKVLKRKKTNNLEAVTETSEAAESTENKHSLIQNMDEFADDLPQGEGTIIGQCLKSGSAPTDESIPSSANEHVEKLPIIKEVVKEVRKEGVIDLKRNFIPDPESDVEPEVSKKIKGESDIRSQVSDISSDQVSNGVNLCNIWLVVNF